MKTGGLSKIIWRYAALEREVQNLISACCSYACSICTSRCCRTDLCEEAFSSPFLKALHGYEPDSTQFSDQYGWLTENGCSLSLGRPPVCYEFFCDDVLNGQRNEGHRYVLRVLGRLLNHVGEQALEKLHLIEISGEEDLNRIPLDRFKEKLNEAKSALEHIRFFYDHGFFDADGMKQLGYIVEPPAQLLNS